MFACTFLNRYTDPAKRVINRPNETKMAVIVETFETGKDRTDFLTNFSKNLETCMIILL